jgi:hypothetical protein
MIVEGIVTKIMIVDGIIYYLDKIGIILMNQNK